MVSRMPQLPLLRQECLLVSPLYRANMRYLVTLTLDWIHKKYHYVTLDQILYIVFDKYEPLPHDHIPLVEPFGLE